MDSMISRNDPADVLARFKERIGAACKPDQRPAMVGRSLGSDSVLIEPS